MLFAVATFTIPIQSHAAIGDPITVTNVIGNWTSTTGGLDVDGVNTNRISWGDNIFSPTQKSSYSFTPTPVVFPVSLDNIFALGEFVHENNPIPVGSAISSATLQIDLDLMIGATAINDLSFAYDFNHDETPNIGGTCPVGSITICDDIITLTNITPLFRSFTVDNVEYTMTVLGLEVDGITFTSALTAEGFANFANMAAIITARELPIPEPETYLILGSALMMLGFVARKKQLSAKS